MPHLHRGAGIVVPLSALPSVSGHGDFASAERWLQWLRSAGMRYWQLLPLTIPDSVGSPFASPSAEAIDPMYISLAWLAEDRLLTKTEVNAAHRRMSSVSTGPALAHKRRLFHLAWKRWLQQHPAVDQRDFSTWRRGQHWLPAFCAYQALKDHYRGRPWWEWPARWQRGTTVGSRFTPHLRRAVEWQAWSQWMLARQWQRVRGVAQRAGVAIIGDLPFYVQYDSVDVWQRPELFLLDRHRKMLHVSGAAPDVFSAHGQKWGTPVYRWSAHRRERWSWWLERIRTCLQMYDIIRFDHFPGLQATWHVPLHARDGSTGHWAPTPGHELLTAIRRQVGHLPLIAEDLGRVSKMVSTLREDFHIPGSRVWQFAWSGLPNNFHEPGRVTSNMVYYTANHDTNTTKGWFRDEAHPYERRHIRRTYGTVQHIAWTAITTVMKHRAVIAMIHIADVFDLGTEARINHPGTKRRNWSWRFQNWPSAQRARKLRALVRASRR